MDRGGWVAIVVLNWNGWADTIACLESLRRLDAAAPARLIVCDNGSTDGSAPRLAAWAIEKIKTTKVKKKQQKASKENKEKENI